MLATPSNGRSVCESHEKACGACNTVNAGAGADALVDEVVGAEKRRGELREAENAEDRLGVGEHELALLGGRDYHGGVDAE